MPLFKSKAQRPQEHHAAEAQRHGANAAVGTGDRMENNTDTGPEHINRQGGGRGPLDNNNPGTGYNNNPEQAHTGTGPATQHHDGVNRVERHVEDAIGSRAIRNQVGEKEQEVNAVKAQSSELAEAERLEREAKMHRDRAVAGGAHPGNQQLGAGWAQ